jgi:hypothetical protein
VLIFDKVIKKTTLPKKNDKGVIFNRARLVLVARLLLCLSLLFNFMSRAEVSRGASFPVLNWVSQFGTDSDDFASSIAVDGSGNIYVAGYVGGILPGQASSGGEDVFVRKYDSKGHELWTRQFGSSGDDTAAGVAVSLAGSVYVVGWTSGALLGQTRLGEDDAFICKYDSMGNQLWIRQFGTTSDDEASSVAVDDLGNVFVVGYTRSALPGQTYLGGRDAFIRKYDGLGNELWTHQFGTEGPDFAYGIAVDEMGNAYVIGTVLGKLPGEHSFGGEDAFIRKYDPLGTTLWVHQFGSSSDDTASAVAVDLSGNAYVVGMTLGALPGQTPSSGGKDAFIRKYGKLGNELWTHQFGSGSWNEACSVAVDKQGNAYVIGQTWGTLHRQVSAGAKDVFIRKYDVAGKPVWTRQLGSSGPDSAAAIALDAYGRICMVGGTQAAFLGQISAGHMDAFVAEFEEQQVPEVTPTETPGIRPTPSLPPPPMSSLHTPVATLTLSPSPTPIPAPPERSSLTTWGMAVIAFALGAGVTLLLVVIARKKSP